MSEVNVQKSAGCNEIKINVKPVPVNPVVLENSYRGIDYNVLKHKPQIEGNELIGNKTAKELLGFDKTDMDATVSVAKCAEEVANAANEKAQNAVDISNDAKETAEGIDDKATQALTNSTDAKNIADSYQGQITTLRNDVDDLGDQVSNIESKIPAEASDSNQLADKAFVNEEVGKINFVKWVTVLPDTGETKYLYAIAREEQDLEGHYIAALYVWDGSAWRGAGGYSLNINPAVFALKTDLDDLGDQVSVIESKIPAEASETNQLADKNYVDNNIPQGVYTQSNLLAGNNIEIVDEPTTGNKVINNTLDVSNLATKTDLTNYLPLTGGTLSGDLKVQGNKVLDTSDKSVTNGVASLDANAKVPSEQIPVATASTLGGVKVDGTTITATADGTISATQQDLSEYAKQADLAAEASARKEADQALDTAVSAKYGPDNLTAGAGVEIKEYTAPTLIDAHTLAVFKFEDTALPAENSVAEGAVFANRGGSADKATAAYGAKFGAGAFRCAGSNVSGWLRNSDSIPNADFTVDFWVKWGNSGRAGVCTGVSSDAPTGRGAVFYKNKISLPQAAGTGYINNDAAFDTPYDAEIWHHCAYVQDGSAYRAYIDGVQVASGAYSSLPTYSDLYVWGWGGVLIDEVRVSDIARYDGDFTPNTQPYAYAEHKQYEITAKASGAGLPLLSVHWSDHLLNRMDMLRADTFSWQDGTVYTAAYQELLGEYNLVDKFYPFSYTGASTGPIQYFCKDLIPAVGDAVYELGADGVYIPATSNDVALLVTSVEMDTSYFGHETALIRITGYGKFIQGDYGSTGKIEDTAPRFSAGILETENGVSFVRTPKGYKIALSDQHDNVAALYESTGAAWYYILDVPNQRFKLPRTKFGFTGLRTGAGNYVAPGLPNITAKMMGTTYGGLADAYVNASGACRTEGSGGASAKGGEEIFLWKHDFDASRSSSVYGASQTVQPPATEMYLYFFVGNYTQTAIEQTAGLNAEMFNGKADVEALNGKANTDLANVASNIDYVVESYKDGNNWYRKYKSGWLEQGGIYTTSTNVENITFLKPFAHIPTIQATVAVATNTFQNGTVEIHNLTTLGFTKQYVIRVVGGWSWYACGKGAE